MDLLHRARAAGRDGDAHRLVAAAARPLPHRAGAGRARARAPPRSPQPPAGPGLRLPAIPPPILWSAAYGASLWEFKEHLRPILQLAFGLVIATTLAPVARSRTPRPD